MKALTCLHIGLDIPLSEENSTSFLLFQITETLSFSYFLCIKFLVLNAWEELELYFRVGRRILLFQLIPWNLYTSRLNPFSNPYPRIRKSFNSVSDATCEVPLFKDRAIFAKGFFNKLISFPLDDLVDPKHETATIESLSILRDNLSLFSDEQAKEIMSLKANFPSTIQDWRDSVQVKVSGEHIWSTFEKTNNLPEDLVKTEEGIKTELEELNNSENELEMQLEGLKSKSREMKEER
ncbi:Hypothetical predicted protein [Olea europaea subsp. europaea]|uniref:Uncharacterized protein n=1 Tax=Olea europaea subsp. europaea TaxID=158383 RepID=A0A8S0SJ71_OLEEU|nr:Hypothetical predicted protein [Olea europaea subsp. europaea]